MICVRFSLVLCFSNGAHTNDTGRQSELDICNGRARTVVTKTGLHQVVGMDICIHTRARIMIADAWRHKLVSMCLLLYSPYFSAQTPPWHSEKSTIFGRALHLEFFDRLHIFCVGCNTSFVRGVAANMGLEMRKS